MHRSPVRVRTADDGGAGPDQADTSESVHVVANLLKQVLRGIIEPVLTDDLLMSFYATDGAARCERAANCWQRHCPNGLGRSIWRGWTAPPAEVEDRTERIAQTAQLVRLLPAHNLNLLRFLLAHFRRCVANMRAWLALAAF